MIEIRDNGPGVPNQVRERLFQAFQSAARHGGTGLGLAIAAELVRAHGGDIRLEDSSEAGSCFLVSIPDHVTQPRAARGGERQISLNYCKACVAGIRRIKEAAILRAPLAQLDRAPDYESGGQEFESLRARQ